MSTSLEHVKTYKQQISAKKLLLLQAQKRLVKDYAKDAGLPFWLLTVQFGVRRLEASIAWAEYALAKLLKMGA